MVALFRILIIVFILLPAAAFAAADDWRVAKATDQASYSVDRMKWVGLRAGDVVPNGAWVSTGPRGRVQLARGVESITFQPNSTASITTEGFFSRKTEIVQQIGSIDLEIEKRSQPHTTVQTPYLAAVVKGTIFHVTVGRTKASVSVDRGLVQVSSFASGQRSNVGPGQSAAVDKKAGMTVAGQKSKPQMTAVAPSIAKVAAVGSTTLAGEVEASKSTGKSAAKSKNTSASAKADNSGQGRANANSNGNGGNKGNSSGNGNSGNSNGNSGGNGGGHGNSGNGNGSGDNSHSGKGNNNSDSHGNGNGGHNGKGKDK
ncbi:UNVERIFIED_ORG: hypothetical protein GGD48_004985 [Rhizobium etli]